MNADWQSITALLVVVVTCAVFAVRTAIRIMKSPDSSSKNCGGGSCGCSAKFKPGK